MENYSSGQLASGPFTSPALSAPFWQPYLNTSEATSETNRVILNEWAWATRAHRFDS
jgi:hypothetical protein